MDDGCDVAVEQAQPVASVCGDGLVRKTESIERTIQPVSTAIDSKNPACAVSAVRGRSQTYDEQPGSRIPKARNRLPPIVPLLVAIHLFTCYFFAPLHQSWASKAPDDLRLQFSG